jgi:lipopolysaccharide export system protein LptA
MIRQKILPFSSRSLMLLPRSVDFIIIVLLSVALFGTSSSSHAKPKIGNAPIAIDADSLEVIQNENKAIFKGNVVAKQSNMTLRSQQMTVFYGQEKAGTLEAMGSLSRIEVNGNVSLVTPTESATSNYGLYDAVRDKVFLTGSVVLKRGGNVLNGSQLEYNLATGSSMLSGGASANTPPLDGEKGGRVRGLFVPDKKE